MEVVKINIPKEVRSKYYNNYYVGGSSIGGGGSYAGAGGLPYSVNDNDEYVIDKTTQFPNIKVDGSMQVGDEFFITHEVNSGWSDVILTNADLSIGHEERTDNPTVSLAKLGGYANFLLTSYNNKGTLNISANGSIKFDHTLTSGMLDKVDFDSKALNVLGGGNINSTGDVMAYVSTSAISAQSDDIGAPMMMSAIEQVNNSDVITKEDVLLEKMLKMQKHIDALERRLDALGN